MVRTFGIVHLAGTPFLLASAPFLMDQAPLLREVPAKFHKMELPPNHTVQKIPYIPYGIYQPASAGNLPIPAKLPVNRWDTTLQIIQKLNNLFQTRCHPVVTPRSYRGAAIGINMSKHAVFRSLYIFSQPIFQSKLISHRLRSITR